MINLDPNYRSLPEQVDYLTDENENNKTDISNLENDVDNLDDRVILNEDAIEDIQDDIEDLQEDVAQNTQNISNLNSEVEAISGRGGYLIPHNFGTATPTEQQLNDYALSQITNITTPEEIFNGTRVTNLYNNHTWILNNTQDTDPVVFEWVDLGQSLVSIATNSTEGVVKGSADNLKVAVAVDGTMSVNGLQSELDSLDNNKQDTLDTTNIPSGTIDESIGFDTDGNVVRGSAGGGGSQLYRHDLNITNSYCYLHLTIINSDNTNYGVNESKLTDYITSLGGTLYYNFFGKHKNDNTLVELSSMSSALTIYGKLYTPTVNETNISFSQSNIQIYSNSHTITDTVTQIL